LIEEFLRIVDESKADGFLFENVQSILHPRNKGTFSSFLAEAAKIGFHTTVIEANALSYGVAQKRQRVVVLGFRKKVIKAPVPSHADSSHKVNGDLKPPVTAKSAIRGFQAKKFFEPEEVVKGRWAEHLREITPGMNYKALTAWAGHPTPAFIAETRFWNFLLKLHPDAPSWTIAANPGPWIGPFHWDNRRLRSVELAALQGFPENYHFLGERRSRVRQIGNAMPPPLARAMIQPLLKAAA